MSSVDFTKNKHFQIFNFEINENDISNKPRPLGRGGGQGMGYTGKILNVNLSEGIIRETKHRAAKVRYSRACEHYQQCRRPAFLKLTKSLQREGG